MRHVIQAPLAFTPTMSDPPSAVLTPTLEPRSVVVDGVRWEYLVGGEGAGPPLLALHGALGGAESIAWFARLLAARRKVIAPTLPAVSTTYEVARGISAVLDAERVRVADVIGGSYGGMVAQAILQERPERVGRVVIAGTGAPDRDRASGEGWVTALLAVLPMGLLRSLARRKLAAHLKVDAPPEARERLAASSGLVHRAIDGLTRDLSWPGSASPTPSTACR